jgi:hypothetical protein
MGNAHSYPIRLVRAHQESESNLQSYSYLRTAVTRFRNGELCVRQILSITDQHYALIITPSFDTQAPTCFGIHVPSSGSFLCPYELLEGRIGYVVCHVL